MKHNGYINHRIVKFDKVAPTVTARGDMKGGAMINYHPNNKRRLSVRETATIQSFPEDFEFIGSMTSCYLQVGNAVPPRLAEAIASCFNNIEIKTSSLDENLVSNLKENSNKICSHQLEFNYPNN